VLAVARETGALLWEALVFPFHDQLARVRELLAGGAIGELREVQSTFQVLIERPADIRLSRALAGGAVNDLVCYPVRLARELFGADHVSAWATANWGGDGVDVDIQGSLGFPRGRRLLLSCGFGRSFDAFSRLLGTRGQIHLTNPFLPSPKDRLDAFASGAEPRSHRASGGEPSFTAALRHIHAVLRGEQQPRLLAVDTSLGNARALHDLLEAAAAAPAGGR
jgi:predicted dehydrogenase